MNFFHSFEEQDLGEDLGEEDENDFSAAMAECAGGGGRRRAPKAVVDIHQCLAIGGRTDGDPVMEFIVDHVGTTEVPVVQADKSKAFCVAVWQLFCALAIMRVIERDRLVRVIEREELVRVTEREGTCE